MKTTLTTLAFTLLLAGCIDTTGISAESSKIPHPQSNVNAAVTVTEYGDIQCPACRAAYTQTVEPLLQQFGSRIRLEFKHFPLSSIHQFAMPAAEASECAADQGKFWDFIDVAYVNQAQLNSKALEQWGSQLGLDMDLFNRCRNSHIKRKAILAEYEAGGKIGVQGTPTFFVNGKKVQSTIQDIGQAITEAEASMGKNL